MADYTFIPTTNLFLFNKGKILFIKRDDNLEDFPGWLMLPGGKQEANETPQEAARREMFEETGLTVDNPELKIISTNNHEYKSKVYLVYIFVAKNFTGELVSIEKGKGEAVWISPEEALQNKKLYPDLRRHLQKITESPDSTEVSFAYHRFNDKLEIVEQR